MSTPRAALIVGDESCLAVHLKTELEKLRRNACIQVPRHGLEGKGKIES